MLRASLLAVALLVAGCATPGAGDVDVGLASVSRVDVSLLEQRLALTLRFQNRGERDFTVDGLAFALDVNGRTLAKGVSRQRFLLPRYGEARVDVEAVSQLSDVLRQITELQRLAAAGDATNRNGAAALSYRIYGRASLEGHPWGLPFDSVVELPLPRELGLPLR